MAAEIERRKPRKVAKCSERDLRVENGNRKALATRPDTSEESLRRISGISTMS